MGLLTLLLVAFAGFAAQLVDGGLGMGFGATSMTILTATAMAPATASAVVNTAQLGTTLASGLSHWKFGNVEWRIVATIGIPGAIGSFVGATFLSRLSLDAAQPLTATILAAIGLLLLIRFARTRVDEQLKKRQESRPLLLGLGTLGGFISASGGAGWGPVTTSALLTRGRITPRRIVGTVSAAEFLVTIAAVIGFIFGLWEEMVANLAAALALMIGGVIGAPIAAWAISRLNSALLGGAVGTVLMVLNVPKVLDFLGVENTAVLVAVRVIILVVGLWLSISGARRRRRAAAENPPVDRTLSAPPTR
ncbi:sulfite exporter TauE/SafE family protein [Corynebacterium yudongzhengii]|uniref:Probable membrane transporter protein n=1 Tax=Corynebacterium yudongzhengii TaxID=2080740 RepID=A0A2U1T5T4_9CORY|nr:sulfite exporter TauE/SafE family protein [Corynebacterium yudongzhengii]AWB82654.1 sulfite exporter TauE/SafE family protein [Corynebacterium yudongzhengii]PWC01380.1 sulfite exporter TauE/SafE family protein [Corynebacterium yudongzhengii]